jgi:hypothetical protein
VRNCTSWVNNGRILTPRRVLPALSASKPHAASTEAGRTLPLSGPGIATRPGPGVLPQGLQNQQVTQTAPSRQEASWRPKPHSAMLSPPQPHTSHPLASKPGAPRRCMGCRCMCLKFNSLGWADSGPPGLSIARCLGRSPPSMCRRFASSLLPMCSLFLPMWVAIHMGRNREHIGSKELAKRLYMAREETVTRERTKETAESASGGFDKGPDVVGAHTRGHPAGAREDELGFVRGLVQELPHRRADISR